VGDFEVETRLERLGEGRYRAHLSRDWNIWGPNGGYLAAIALRAAGREAAIARPVAFAGHFLRVADFEAVELEVTALRRGRRSESLRVSMSQAGRPVLEALVRTAAEAPGLAHDVAPRPDVPDPDTLPSMDELLPPEAPRHAFWRNLESRPLDPERVGKPPGPRPPEARQWCRFRPRALFDEPFLDAGRLLLLIDTFTWPAAVGPHQPEPAFTAPNLDVCVWFHRADPDGEWLLADQVSPVAEAGTMGTVGRVFARDGRLLASGGAQLLCVPVTPAT